MWTWDKFLHYAKLIKLSVYVPSSTRFYVASGNTWTKHTYTPSCVITQKNSQVHEQVTTFSKFYCGWYISLKRQAVIQTEVFRTWCPQHDPNWCFYHLWTDFPHQNSHFWLKTFTFKRWKLSPISSDHI